MSNCIISPYTKNKAGYAYKTQKGKAYLHHRLVYMQHHSVTLNPNQIVMHSCDNPSCINIDHLSIGSHQDNTNDKVNKHRHYSKLSVNDVLFIRGSSLSINELAEMFNVTNSTIYRVVSRRTYSHL